MPDHLTLSDCGHFTWSLSISVEMVCDFASKGEAEREALRLDEGLILDAKRRLDNLVDLLGLLNHRRAAA